MINRSDRPKEDEAKNDKKLIPTIFHAGRPTLHLHQGHQTYELSYHCYTKGGDKVKIYNFGSNKSKSE